MSSKLPNLFITTLAQTLAQGGSETEFFLSSITTFDGQIVQTSDFAEWGRGIIIVDPQSASRAEFMSFTSVSSGNVSFQGGIRGLSSKDNTVITANKKFHPVGATVIISFGTHNISDMVDKFADIGSSEMSITGLWNFLTSPTVPTAVNPTEAVNLAQLQAATQSGGVDASTIAKGISRLTVSPNKTLGTATITQASPAVVSLASHGLTVNDTIQFTTTGTLPLPFTAGTTYYVISAGLTSGAFELALTLGGTAINTTTAGSGTHTLIRSTPYVVDEQDGRLPTQAENDSLVGNNTDIPVGTGNKLITQTGLQHGAEKYVLAASASSTAYTGTYSPAPTSITNGMEFFLKIDIANTTTNPTFNPNGLGAKTIVKGTSLSLAPNDLFIGQIARFIYDGTNMVLQNPSTLTTFSEFMATLGTSVIGNAASAVVSKTDGTEICFAHQNPGVNNVNWTIGRMAQDTVTGTWYLVETTTFAAGSSNSINTPGLTYVGAFIFFSVYDGGASTKNLYRFSATNLTAGATAFTYSGTSPNTGGQSMYTNGTDLIIYGGSTNWYRYTLSGTVATNAATLTGPAAAPAINYDGTNVYMYDGVTLSKYAVTLGSATATLTRSSFYFGTNSHFAGIQFINSQALNVISTGLSGQNLLFFTPITKI